MKNVIVLFALLSTLGIAAQEEKIPVVSVTAEGIVNVVPDKVIIKARVEHQGESATEVKQKNDSTVSEVLEFLESEGIPSKNIQTEYLNLDKRYDYNTKEYSYSANQAISIQLEDLDKYEGIMSGLLASGLNRIDGVEFQTSKKEELESEARKEAMLNAQEKAGELASALNQSIGMAVRITEMETNHFQPVFRTMKFESASSSDSQTIAPGEMEIRVRVNVEFLLGNKSPGKE